MIAFCTAYNLLTPSFIAYKIMDFPFLQWPSGLLCWWIFNVPEVGLNLVFLSIYFRTSCTDECWHCTKSMISVCSCPNSYYTFHLFPLLASFLKLVAFCTAYNQLTPFLLPYKIIDLSLFVTCTGAY